MKKVNLWKRMRNQTSPNNLTPKVSRRAPKVPKVKAIIPKKSKNFPPAENASINCAHQRKSTKKFAPESNKTNTVSSAKIAMKITTTISIANSASKSTLTAARMKMMINGSVVTIVKDG